MKSPIFVCRNCGSTRVQQRAWIDINTKRIVDDLLHETEDTYCPDCMESAGAMHLTMYTNDCYKRLAHDCEKNGEFIAKMLRSVLFTNPNPNDSESLRNLLERLSDEQIRDMSLRMKFLEDLTLALDELIDLKNSTPTHMTCIIRGQEMKHVFFRECSKYEGLSRMIPNRGREYKSVEQFIEDILDLNKTSMITRLEKLSAVKLPF